MSSIANNIAMKINWQEYYVGECEKLEMVKEVLNEFTTLMEESIKIASK